MKLEIVLILISICFNIQTKPIFHKKNYNNYTKSNLLLCYSNNHCQNNSWCYENKCQCKKGWITLYKSKQCSYKQISKFSTFIISLLLGSTGIDWFFLSRQNHFYILIGLVKFLLFIAACIWNRLALISKTKRSMIVAGCIGISLSIISIIWWLIDWIRILLNYFPDGNNIPLFN